MTEHPPSASPTVFGQRPWLLPLLTGIAGFIVGVGAFGIGSAAINAAAGAQADAAAQAEEDARTSVFANALDKCGLDDDEDSQIGDGGHTLTINHRGDDDFAGIEYADLECIIERLGTPAAVSSHIGQTTSQDGRQTEMWDGITMSWSYHPDRGLDAVYTID